MEIKTIIISVCLIMSGLHGLAAQNIRAEFEKDLAEKAVTIESIDCDFTQIRTMSVLADEARETGHFTYSRPDSILLEFEDGDYIHMTEERFAMRDGGRESDVKVSSNPMLRELKKVLGACMSGDLSRMSTGFSMEIEKIPGGYSVTLTPVKGRGQAKFGTISMDFDQADMSLDMLCIEEASGDSLKYEFRNKKFNQTK